MLRRSSSLARLVQALVASAALATFVPLTSGLASFLDGDCDCSSLHQDGDDEDHCPPFCGSCLDCAGCFHVHAVLTAPPGPLAVRIPVLLPGGTPVARDAPPDAPTAEALHVPRPIG